MDTLLLLASGLTLLLSGAHSILGEQLVFTRLRKDGVWSEASLNLLERRRWWSVRATWHLVSIMGVGFAALLFSEAFGGIGVERTIGLMFVVATVYWAVATRFGHPAWIVMAVIAALLLVPN
ncbi:hypothetical protein [Brevundimonas sp. TWP2-3-2]|uniref:hypothetical protein n=1 Tax=Brevundimonas sp. TWP2-3-2 TaxID=2804648 RepID=UPI003CFB3963